MGNVLPEELIIMILDLTVNGCDENYRLLYYTDFFGLKLVCKKWNLLIRKNAHSIYCDPYYYTNRIHRDNRNTVKRIVLGDILPVSGFLELKLYVSYKRAVMCEVLRMLNYRKGIKSVNRK